MTMTQMTTAVEEQRQEQLNEVKERASEEGKIPRQYNSLLRTINQKMKNVHKNYNSWIRQMYNALTKVGTCTPAEARRIVELDATNLGISKQWIAKCMPAEAKNPVRLKVGRRLKKRAQRKRAKKKTYEAKKHLIEKGIMTPLASNILVLDLGEVVLDSDGKQVALLDAFETAIQRAQRFNTDRIRLLFDEERVKKGILVLAGVDAVIPPKGKAPKLGTPPTPTKAQGGVPA